MSGFRISQQNIALQGDDLRYWYQMSVVLMLWLKTSRQIYHIREKLTYSTTILRNETYDCHLGSFGLTFVFSLFYFPFGSTNIAVLWQPALCSCESNSYTLSACITKTIPEKCTSDFISLYCSGLIFDNQKQSKCRSLSQYVGRGTRNKNFALRFYSNPRVGDKALQLVLHSTWRTSLVGRVDPSHKQKSDTPFNCCLALCS